MLRPILLSGALVLLVTGRSAGQPGAQPGLTPRPFTVPAKASVSGKYLKLLKVIGVPGDRAGHGDFQDYGRKEESQYAGHGGLPPGYWVYVAPNWYIWGELAGQPTQVPPTPVTAPPGPPPAVKAEPRVPDRASVNGKYTNLLRKIHVPGDQATYGAFYDFGSYTGTSWAGHDNLPPGYWVYLAPDWYIWGGLAPADRIPAQGVKPEQGQGQVPAQASVNGKYDRLLKVINVPGDNAQYGPFTDYGYHTGTSWAGYDNLPVGYWVYAYPNWYIWGTQRR